MTFDRSSILLCTLSPWFLVKVETKRRSPSRHVVVLVELSDVSSKTSQLRKGKALVSKTKLRTGSRMDASCTQAILANPGRHHNTCSHHLMRNQPRSAIP